MSDKTVREDQNTTVREEQNVAATRREGQGSAGSGGVGVGSVSRAIASSGSCRPRAARRTSSS